MKNFIYHIDSPSIMLQPQEDFILIRGWIASVQGTIIGDPFIMSESEELIKLEIVERADVIQANPNSSVMCFSSIVSILDLGVIETLEIKFDIDGSSEVIFTPLKIDIDKFNILKNKKDRKFKKIQSAICCPKCKFEDLIIDDINKFIQCTGCYNRYDISTYKMNFLSNEFIEIGKVKDTPNVSAHQYDKVTLDIINKYKDGLILDNGCGLRSEYYENIVNFEIVDYPTTDVLGIGEYLPFKTNAFDAIFTLNVLEHVRDPFRCAKEIARCLKPGGVLVAVVPFLQPFHGYPDHYYNMTSSGLKNLFIENGLKVVDCYNPNSGAPIWTLSWFLNSYTRGLPTEVSERFKKLTVEDLMKNPTEHLSEDYVIKLQNTTREELASTNLLIATK